jgi:hypothetical protein
MAIVQQSYLSWKIAYHNFNVLNIEIVKKNIDLYYKTVNLIRVNQNYENIKNTVNWKKKNWSLDFPHHLRQSYAPRAFLIMSTLKIIKLGELFFKN